MINAFTSSAIEAISTTDDGNVLVTFTGGRQYTYTVADRDAFVNSFNAAVSKGQFMNQQIKSETLQKVAV
jgi:arabinogalactan endo-1,4-beta-galactosidase